jgi:hypothetical protein
MRGKVGLAKPSLSSGGQWRRASACSAGIIRIRWRASTAWPRLGAIDTRIAQIDKRLAADFPDYFALASPQPLSVEAAQAQLRPDEALVVFLDTKAWKPAPEETFIWVVTKTQIRWIRSELGTIALTREVQALRCGLDLTA